MEPPSSSPRSSVGGYSDNPRASSRSAGLVAVEDNNDAVVAAEVSDSITPAVAAEPIQRRRLLVGENDDNWLFLREDVNDNINDDNDFGDNSVGIVGGGSRSRLTTTIHRFRWSVLKLLLAVAFGIGIVHVSLNRSSNNSNSSSGGGISNVEGGNNEEESNSSEAGIMGVEGRFEDFDAESMANTNLHDDQDEEEETFIGSVFEEEPNNVTLPNDDDVTPDWWCGTCNWKNVSDCDARVQGKCTNIILPN